MTNAVERETLDVFARRLRASGVARDGGRGGRLQKGPVHSLGTRVRSI